MVRETVLLTLDEYKEYRKIFNVSFASLNLTCALVCAWCETLFGLAYQGIVWPSISSFPLPSNVFTTIEPPHDNSRE